MRCECSFEILAAVVSASEHPVKWWEMTNCEDELAVYFAGKRIFGDSFTGSEICAWYEDEKEGYADLVSESSGGYQYAYHALNDLHGYRYLTEPNFASVLGMGSAYGDEFLPIADRFRSLAIVDPSSHFEECARRLPLTPRYVRPSPDGILPFEDNVFTLITCLGVLHHIPNVTRVVGEMARCLGPGGRLLVREPIVSMGDWRRPRRGLTKRERGIPRELLLNAFTNSGLQVERATDCMFPAVPRIARMMGAEPYNSRFWTYCDLLLSAMFRWNYTYHPTSVWRKLRPTGIYIVAFKA